MSIFYSSEDDWRNSRKDKKSVLDQFPVGNEFPVEVCIDSVKNSVDYSLVEFRAKITTIRLEAGRKYRALRQQNGYQNGRRAHRLGRKNTTTRNSRPFM